MITKEQLIESGWKEGIDPAGRLYKEIENINPLNASEDTDIQLVIHTMYNQPQVAIALPDGGLLNFNPQSMEELNQLETMISFYDAPF